jgi:hypothetical protein
MRFNASHAQCFFSFFLPFTSLVTKNTIPSLIHSVRNSKAHLNAISTIDSLSQSLSTPKSRFFRCFVTFTFDCPLSVRETHVSVSFSPAVSHSIPELFPFGRLDQRPCVCPKTRSYFCYELPVFPHHEKHHRPPLEFQPSPPYLP